MAYDRSRNYPGNDRVNNIMKVNNPLLAARNDKDRTYIFDNFYKMDNRQQEESFVYLLSQINLDSMIGLYLSKVSYKGDIILNRVFEGETNDQENGKKRYNLYYHLIKSFTKNIESSRNYSKMDDLSVPFEELLIRVKMHLIDNDLVSEYADFVERYYGIFSYDDFYNELPSEYRLNIVL